MISVNTFVIVIFIIIGGYFATIEAALISVNRRKSKLLAENGEKEDIKFHNYINHISDMITLTVMITVLSKSFAGVWAGAALAPHVVAALDAHGVMAGGRWLWLAVVTGLGFIVTFLSVTAVQLVPKRIGIKHSEKIASSTMGIMTMLSTVFKPFIFIHTAAANLIARMFGIDPAEVDFIITEEELRRMVADSGSSGEIDENEIEMINNIFDFDNTSAGDIATHRTDIVAFPINQSIAEMKEIVMNEKFSRFPVYNDNIDDIVGIFHVKDFAKQLIYGGSEDFDLKSILMEPYFVPFSKKNDELFEEMQKKKIHMSIIIDEYGGTAGLVTMEDLIEEIVGNIFDEYDEVEEEEIRAVSDSCFLLKGTADISDVEEALGLSLDPDEDYDTIGGFLIGRIGRIPDTEETPEIEYGGYMFKVERVVEKRIDLIRALKQET